MLTREGDRVRLDVTRDQYRELLRIVDARGKRAEVFHGARVVLDAARAQVELGVEEWEAALMCLGRHSGMLRSKHGKDSPEFYESVRLVDELNEGNPQYRPYNYPEPSPEPSAKKARA